MKKLEKNWRRWKKDRQIDENKHLKNMEEKMEEENEKIRNRDWRTEHFSGGEILKKGLLWQPLDTKSNDHTTSKSFKVDI